VLALGVLLLDDRWIARLVFRETEPDEPSPPSDPAPRPRAPLWRLCGSATALTWIFYATCADFLFTGAPPELAWLLAPVRVLEPLRIANRYGLFAVMTPARYEIELQGTRDGVTWTAYPFRYKPQALDVAPGIYAPYQPRFEWNLWFASLGGCRDNGWVYRTEVRLLEGDASVLTLFASNPFDGTPPVAVRSIASQYWFTELADKRATGRWWKRDDIGPYCGVATAARVTETKTEPTRWSQ
jgi:lipase maturation factor 1